MIGPAWVGDMVLSQPLLAQLVQQDGAVVDVLAPAWSRPVLQRMPEVSQIWEMPVGHGRFGLAERWRLGVALRSQSYDQAIVLPNSWKSALIPWVAQIPWRTGWRGEWRYGLLNDLRVLDPLVYPRMVDRFMALAVAIGDPLPVCPPPQLRIRADQVERALAVHALQRTRPVVALCPGAEFGPSKQWPPAYFAALSQALIERGWVVWILGSANDRQVAATIETALSQAAREFCHNLCGLTTLEQVMDLLQCPDLVVSNDSGLMHVAAAVAPERRLWALYGSTSPVFTPPLAKAARIFSKPLACSPCFARTCPLKHHACMRDLLPTDLLQRMHQEGDL